MQEIAAKLPLPTEKSSPARLSYAPLLIGSALIFMTFMRYSLAELAWLVFAPFLVYLHKRATLRRHVAVSAILVIAFVAAVSKMATAEIPWAPVPMFAVPLALSSFLAIAAGSWAHRRLGAGWGIYAFAAALVVLGWIQYTFTEGGSWGVLAHTQLDNLSLVQVAALTGLGGVTFIVAMGSALAAAAWSVGVKTVRPHIIAFAILLGSALAYGELRLGSPAPGASVRIGALVSPVTHKDFYAAHESLDTLRPLDAELFARTARAADLGAKVIVWNEIATVVTPSGENDLASRGQAFARQRRVLLLMAYGVAESMHPFHYVNKYRIYGPDGSMADEYIKRHPVPVDPSDKGTAHSRIVTFDGVKYTGAICYDYSFPAIAADNAADGADVVLLPSSDWRGIDPEHGRMALDECRRRWGCPWYVPCGRQPRLRLTNSAVFWAACEPTPRAMA